MRWNTTKRSVAARAALVTLIMMSAAHAGDEQPCQPGWVPTFGGVQELNDLVRTVVTFDDGTGVALYAGGDFTRAHTTTAMHIAKWDGQAWTALGAGTNAPVRSMAVFDDGSGSVLYVGGSFTTAGGVPAQGIAKWDGTTWTALGDGFTIDAVNALEVFDEGTGPALYAGGLFLTTGGIPTQAGKVGRWDGQRWSVLGEQFDHLVADLCAFDDGTGPVLYAGGWFDHAGTIAVSKIARWNGSQWTSVGSGMQGTQVNAMLADEDESGPALIVGGTFSTAGGAAVNNLATWDGSKWAPLGNGVYGFPATSVTVRTLYRHTEDEDSRLYIGGDFRFAGNDLGVRNLCTWANSSYATVAGGRRLAAAHRDRRWRRPVRRHHRR